MVKFTTSANHEYWFFPTNDSHSSCSCSLQKGELSLSDYEAAMKKEIEFIVREQEKLDLDVLVHGEAERNDMVEYFGELLDGFAFTNLVGYKVTVHVA